MTTYSIYFINKSSIKKTYGLFSEPPQLTGNTGSGPVYSNVFLSTSLETDGDWSISLTKSYYAWCGSLPQKLAPGMVVSTGNAKLSTLGSDTAPGSTWTVYNNSGNAAFQPVEKRTANPGAFEIDSGFDFTPENNFVIGLAGVDDLGRAKPLAMVPTIPNQRVNIKPITRYFISDFSAKVGTVIDTSASSLKVADIDFSAHPGMFGAVVTQDTYGVFNVKYTSQMTYGLEVINSQSEKLGAAWQLNALQEYVDVIGSHLKLAAIAAPADNRARFIGSVAILNTSVYSPQTFMSTISPKFAGGWQYESGTVSADKQKVLVTFSHVAPATLAEARTAFNSAYIEVPDNIRAYYVDPQVNDQVAGAQPTGVLASDGPPPPQDSQPPQEQQQYASQQSLGLPARPRYVPIAA